jgi:hypothetical protein
MIHFDKGEGHPLGKKNLGFALTPHDHYLEVVFNGLLVKQTVLSSLNRLLNHPEYYEKHSLLNFSDIRVGVSMNDIKEILGVMRLFSPKKADFANRSAWLVAGQVNRSLAEMIIEMAKTLPFDFKVFSDSSRARGHLMN